MDTPFLYSWRRRSAGESEGQVQEDAQPKGLYAVLVGSAHENSPSQLSGYSKIFRISFDSRDCTSVIGPSGHEMQFAFGLDSQLPMELRELPDGSIGLLHFGEKCTPEFFVRSAPYWLSKLSCGAKVSGAKYGRPRWPDYTTVVVGLFGVPDHVSPRGFWRCLFIAPKVDAIDGPGSIRMESCCIIIAATGVIESDGILISLIALRKVWNGRILVEISGEIDGSLALVCARMRTEIRLCPLAALDSRRYDGSVELWREEPWISTLVVMRAGTVVTTFIEEVIRSSSRGRIANGAMSCFGDADLGEPGILILRREGGAIAATCLPSTPSSRVKEGRYPPTIAFHGNRESWSEAALEIWCSWEVCLLQTLACEIPVRPRAAIVSIVTPASAAEIEHASLTWNFPEGTKTTLFLANVCPNELFMPGISKTTDMVALQAQQAASPYALATCILNNTEADYLIFIPPSATAEPGAELFSWESCANYDAIWHFKYPVHCNWRRCRDVPPSVPVFACVSRKFLNYVLGENRGQRNAPPNLSSLLFLGEGQASFSTRSLDMRKKGWQGFSSHYFSSL